MTPTPADVEAAAEPEQAPAPRRRLLSLSRPAPPSPRPTVTDAARPTGAPGARGRTAVNPDDEPMWGRLGLLALLGMVFVLQVLINLVAHQLTSSHRALLVDLFDFNAYPLLMLPSCVLLMPLAKRLTHQPRTLRFLESLSLGAVYAIFVLLLAVAFVPVPPTAKTAQQIANSLTVSNVPALALGNVVALLVAVQIYPGLNRLLGAPGRKARKRMIARQGGAAGPRSRSRPTGAKPVAAKPAAKRTATGRRG